MAGGEPSRAQFRGGPGRWLAAGLLGWLGLTLAGCSLLPEAKPDPTRFYVLTSTAERAAPTADRGTWQLRPIEVASYLRNPPLVVRRGANEVEFREYARWGEPLEQGVARVLREEMHGRGIHLGAGGTRYNNAELPLLTVRVLACEGTAAGAVEFRAAWELTKGISPVVRMAGGEFRAEGLRWSGKSEAELAAGLSTAVAQLAEAIAAAPRP